MFNGNGKRVCALRGLLGITSAALALILALVLPAAMMAGANALHLCGSVACTFGTVAP